MTYQEYEAKINESLTNFDRAPEIMKGVLDELKKDTTTISSLTTQVGEQTKRIKDLQETNVKLFLRTGDGKKEEKEEPEVEKTPQDYMNDFIKSLMGDEKEGNDDGND